MFFRIFYLFHATLIFSITSSLAGPITPITPSPITTPAPIQNYSIAQPPTQYSEISPLEEAAPQLDRQAISALHSLEWDTSPELIEHVIALFNSKGINLKVKVLEMKHKKDLRRLGNKMNKARVKAILVPPKHLIEGDTIISGIRSYLTNDGTTGAGHFRTKRGTGSDELTKLCHIESAIIDFREFGWDWVIAPGYYDAKKAVGYCPPFLSMKDKVSVYQTLLSNAMIAKPKCVATEFANISFFYFDDNDNVRYEILKKAVAVKAGCRF